MMTFLRKFECNAASAAVVLAIAAYENDRRSREPLLAPGRHCHSIADHCFSSQCVWVSACCEE